MSTLTLRRWNPFEELDALFRSVGPVQPTTAFRPAAEVIRDGEDALIRLELPGVDIEKDVTVEVENDTLIVKGERRDERSEENGRRVLREVRYGSFRRAFRLPSHVTDADVTANYDAGVLTVRVAGAYAGSTPTRIPVTVQAA